MSTYTISMVGVLGDIKVLTGVAPTVCMDSVIGGVMYVVVPGIYFTWTWDSAVTLVHDTGVTEGAEVDGFLSIVSVILSDAGFTFTLDTI